MDQVRVERHFQQAPDRVWAALTSSDALASWLWPPTFDTVANVDLRVGGGFAASSTPMDMAVSGEFLEIEPQSRLVETWQWRGEDATTRVTFSLEPSGTGTAVTVLHDGFTTPEEVADHVTGWSDCLARLPAYLNR